MKPMDGPQLGMMMLGLLGPNGRQLARVEMLDQVSTAFMVALQRLTPAERAILLLRGVFEFDYSEIAALVERSEPACRKLLERARENVAKEKRLFAASPESTGDCSPRSLKHPHLLRHISTIQSSSAKRQSLDNRVQPRPTSSGLSNT
jgi:hypothetical protein